MANISQVCKDLQQAHGDVFLIDCLTYEVNPCMTNLRVLQSYLTEHGFKASLKHAKILGTHVSKKIAFHWNVNFQQALDHLESNPHKLDHYEDDELTSLASDVPEEEIMEDFNEVYLKKDKSDKSDKSEGKSLIDQLRDAEQALQAQNQQVEEPENLAIQTVKINMLNLDTSEYSNKIMNISLDEAVERMNKFNLNPEINKNWKCLSVEAVSPLASAILGHEIRFTCCADQPNEPVKANHRSKNPVLTDDYLVPERTVQSDKSEKTVQSDKSEKTVQSEKTEYVDPYDDDLENDDQYLQDLLAYEDSLKEYADGFDSHEGLRGCMD